MTAIEQRTDEWHERRSTHVTASGVGAILGHSPWATPREFVEQKAYEKVFGRTKDDPTPPMLEGIEWEPRLIEMSRPHVLGFGDNRYEEHGYITHPEYDWIGASPDQIIVAPDGKIVTGLEVKKQFSRSKKGPEDWEPVRETHPHYWDQCQLSIHVFDTPDWHFYASNGEWETHQVIRREDEWLNIHMPTFERFIAEFNRLVEYFTEQKESQS